MLEQELKANLPVPLPFEFGEMGDVHHHRPRSTSLPEAQPRVRRPSPLKHTIISDGTTSPMAEDAVANPVPTSPLDMVPLANWEDDEELEVAPYQAGDVQREFGAGADGFGRRLSKEDLEVAPLPAPHQLPALNTLPVSPAAFKFDWSDHDTTNDLDWTQSDDEEPLAQAPAPIVASNDTPMDLGGMAAEIGPAGTDQDPDSNNSEDEAMVSVRPESPIDSDMAMDTNTEGDSKETPEATLSQQQLSEEVLVDVPGDVSPLTSPLSSDSDPESIDTVTGLNQEDEQSALLEYDNSAEGQLEIQRDELREMLHETGKHIFALPKAPVPATPEKRIELLEIKKARADNEKRYWRSKARHLQEAHTESDQLTRRLNEALDENRRLSEDRTTAEVKLEIAEDVIKEKDQQRDRDFAQFNETLAATRAKAEADLKKLEAQHQSEDQKAAAQHEERLSKLRTQIEDLNTCLRRTAEKENELSQCLAERQVQLANLQAEINIRERNTQEIIVQLEEAVKERDDLSQQLTAKASKEKEELEDRRHDAEKQCAMLQENSKRLEAERDQLQADIRQLQAQAQQGPATSRPQGVATGSTNLTALQAEVQRLRNFLQQKDQTLQTAKRNLQAEADKTKRLAAESWEHQTANRALRQQFQASDDRCRRLQADLDELRAANPGNFSELTRLETKVADLEKERASLMETASREVNNVRQSKTEAYEARILAEKLQVELDEKKNRIEKLEAERIRRVQENQQRDAERIEMEQRQKEFSATKSQLQTTNEEIAVLKQKLESAEARIQKPQAPVPSFWKQEKEQLQQIIEQRDATITAMHAQYDEQYNNLAEELAQARQDSSARQEELQKVIEENQTTIDTLNNDCETLAAQVPDLQGSLAKAEQKNQDLQKRINELEKQLEQARQALPAPQSKSPSPDNIEKCERPRKECDGVCKENDRLIQQAKDLEAEQRLSETTFTPEAQDHEITLDIFDWQADVLEALSQKGYPAKTVQQIAKDSELDEKRVRNAIAFWVGNDVIDATGNDTYRIKTNANQAATAPAAQQSDEAPTSTDESSQGSHDEDEEQADERQHPIESDFIEFELTNDDDTPIVNIPALEWQCDVLQLLKDHPEDHATVAKLLDRTGYDETTVRNALAFWVGAGVLVAVDKDTYTLAESANRVPQASSAPRLLVFDVELRDRNVPVLALEWQALIIEAFARKENTGNNPVSESEDGSDSGPEDDLRPELHGEVMTVTEISQMLNMSEELVHNAAAFWVGKGVLLQMGRDTYKIAEYSDDSAKALESLRVYSDKMKQKRWEADERANALQRRVDDFQNQLDAAQRQAEHGAMDSEKDAKIEDLKRRLSFAHSTNQTLLDNVASLKRSYDEKLEKSAADHEKKEKELQDDVELQKLLVETGLSHAKSQQTKHEDKEKAADQKIEELTTANEKLAKDVADLKEEAKKLEKPEDSQRRQKDLERVRQNANKLQGQLGERDEEIERLKVTVNARDEASKAKDEKHAAEKAQLTRRSSELQQELSAAKRNAESLQVKLHSVEASLAALVKEYDVQISKLKETLVTVREVGQDAEDDFASKISAARALVSSLETELLASQDAHRRAQSVADECEAHLKTLATWLADSEAVQEALHALLQAGSHPAATLAAKIKDMQKDMRDTVKELEEKVEALEKNNDLHVRMAWKAAAVWNERGDKIEAQEAEIMTLRQKLSIAKQEARLAVSPAVAGMQGESRRDTEDFQQTMAILRWLRNASTVRQQEVWSPRYRPTTHATRVQREQFQRKGLESGAAVRAASLYKQLGWVA